MSKKIALTGIKPSGQLHFGNYFGAIKPALELQEKYDCIYFVADLHALTTFRSPAELQEFKYDVVASWLALGLNIEKHTLFCQSDVACVTELAWYLSCFTGFGFLERAHAFKDASAKNKEVNLGTFSYPVLMAADILLYDADYVPVGKDQKQHLEMARDIANSLNNAVNSEVLRLPEPLISEAVMTIPGTDGQKMSKSYNNVIPLFCSEKELRKKVMGIPTDSTALELPKELDGTLLADWLKLFANEEQYSTLKNKLAEGGYGWGNAKEDLFNLINQHIQPARDRYNEIRSDQVYLNKILVAGKEKAEKRAKSVLTRVRSALGIG